MFSGTKTLNILQQYSVGEDISVWVDRVGPFNNPQEFYMYHNLPFCRPTEAKGKLEGLGESIAGYELRRSAISVSFAGMTKLKNQLKKKTIKKLKQICSANSLRICL